MTITRRGTRAHRLPWTGKMSQFAKCAIDTPFCKLETHLLFWEKKKKSTKKVVTVGIDPVIPDVESGALTTELEISS